MREALFYKKVEGETLVCELCPHRCRLAVDAAGLCKARVNRGGVLYSKSYSEISSLALDPIEKKPLYHFYPGSDILSIGSFGCNLSCSFCQNWQISQNRVETKRYSPDDVVQAALGNNSIGIAYTYNEPLINYEFVLETSKLARSSGLKNVLVSNGYINPEPLSELLPVIDAVNLDIKAGEDRFYSELCGGRLEPVLESAKKIVAYKVHLEVTTLLIPEQNDSERELRWLASWVGENCGRDTVAHLSAYFPRYKLQARETELGELLNAYNIFKESLKYVYCGNISVQGNMSNTYCVECSSELISRSGYYTEIIGIDTSSGACAKCGASTPIIL